MLPKNEIIPFSMTSKRVLNRFKKWTKFRNEMNYKIYFLKTTKYCWEKLKADTETHTICSYTIHNIIKVAILPTTIYRFEAVAIKKLETFYF